MEAIAKSTFLRQSVGVFLGVPLVVWLLGGFPTGSLLKESLSVIAMLAFCQMIGLFFWSRTNWSAVWDLKMSQIIGLHKSIGYACVAVMLLHPLFLVVPRIFESGVALDEAFFTIITTFNRGIVLGIIAWCLLLTIGVTALVRSRLPLKYRTWRTFHGILAVLFVFTASWHVIDLGRHSSLAMSIVILILAAGAVRLLLRQYTSNQSLKTRI